MNRLFGTDGVRGKANRYPMTPDLVLRLGQEIGRYFKKSFPKPRILIGKDTRQSGYMLEQALSSGICSVGVNVGFLGPLPTPGIAYLTRGMRACAGIVISASHNPYCDNGIKIFSADGYKLPDAIEMQLEAALFSNGDDGEFPINMGIGRAKRIDDAVGQYAVFLKEQFPKHLTLEGMRIALDCANGAAYTVAPKVYEELGAELFIMGNSPNGCNINDNCGALYPQKLIEMVHMYKADIGLAFDGDADRLIVVDDQANLVDGDEIMAICATHMSRKKTLKANGIVATVMSNMGLDLAMKKLGVKVIREKVGDRYVVDAMRKGKFNLGGEQSGHLIFRDSSTTGDGILAGLILLEIMRETGESISNLRKCVSLLPQTLKNISVTKKVPLEELKEFCQKRKNFEKELGANGRILVRYSGTENLARVMVEGKDSSLIENMGRELGQLLTAEIANYR